MYLLTVGNPKTQKGVGRGYLTVVLHLAPARTAGYGTVCAGSTPGCESGCLYTAGRAGILKAGETDNSILRARIRRTALFFKDRAHFMRLLVADVQAAQRMAKRLKLRLCVRLNGTSDLPWEKIPADEKGNTLFDLFPRVMWYDYTKIAFRARQLMPRNYHLTYSLGETDANRREAATMPIDRNIAVVFAGPLPAYFMGRPVIDGDRDDLRFLDPAGVVVGLKAKGRAKRDTTGFVVRGAA